MHILALCNGSFQGNSEILLKAALNAAVKSDPSITTSWIHVPSVVVPRNAPPFRGKPEIIPRRPDEEEGDQEKPPAPSKPEPEPDDRQAVYRAIMAADAIVIATPIYSRQPAGTLKAVGDSILGPFADVSTAFRTARRKAEGDPAVQDVDIDPLQLKPRVAAFIGVAGSAQQFQEQWTMALPTMHLLMYPIHATVVDQVVIPGNANPAAVLLRPESTLARAELLGQRVASQMGKPVDEAHYLGPEEKGSCPYCHLLKIGFRGTGKNEILCLVCGAHGKLTVSEEDGAVTPEWEQDSKFSGLTLEGKWNHINDITEQLEWERAQLPGILDEWEKWKAIKIPQVALPSNVEQLGKSLDTSRL